MNIEIKPNKNNKKSNTLLSGFMRALLIASSIEAVISLTLKMF